MIKKERKKKGKVTGEREREIGLVLWHNNHCRSFNVNPFLYICIKYIGFSWVLWHINYCRLLNAKSFLYIYNEYIWSGFMAYQPLWVI